MGEQMADENRDDRADPSVAPGATDPAAAAPDGAAASSAADSKPSEADGAAPHAAASSETKADAAASGEGAARPSSHIMVLPPSRDGGWHGAADETGSASGATRSGLFGKRRTAAMAAVLALAAVAGVIGGALASAALRPLLRSESGDTAKPQIQALESTIEKLNGEIAALKAGAERAAKADAAQLSKVNERIDRVEKAQAEPAAKIARLSEAVDKLRVAAAAAPSPAPAAAQAQAQTQTKEASKEVTGSVPAAAGRPAEANRLPTVPGWRLRDVANGGALIEGRDGLYEVYAGDPLPGLGRVDAIRRQDGRWVVVTSRGLIVSR